jgi:hypothetical protein
MCAGGVVLLLLLGKIRVHSEMTAAILSVIRMKFI